MYLDYAFCTINDILITYKKNEHHIVFIIFSMLFKTKLDDIYLPQLFPKIDGQV
jgi:hypothetical protein